MSRVLLEYRDFVRVNWETRSGELDIILHLPPRVVREGVVFKAVIRVFAEEVGVEQVITGMAAITLMPTQNSLHVRWTPNEDGYMLERSHVASIELFQRRFADDRSLDALDLMDIFVGGCSPAKDVTAWIIYSWPDMLNGDDDPVSVNLPCDELTVEECHAFQFHFSLYIGYSLLEDTTDTLQEAVYEGLRCIVGGTHLLNSDHRVELLFFVATEHQISTSHMIVQVLENVYQPLFGSDLFAEPHGCLYKRAQLFAIPAQSIPVCRILWLLSKQHEVPADITHFIVSLVLLL
jgi:hypothetical protein